MNTRGSILNAFTISLLSTVVQKCIQTQNYFHLFVGLEYYATICFIEITYFLERIIRLLVPTNTTCSKPLVLHKFRQAAGISFQPENTRKLQVVKGQTHGYS